MFDQSDRVAEGVEALRTALYLAMDEGACDQQKVR